MKSLISYNFHVISNNSQSLVIITLKKFLNYIKYTKMLSSCKVFKN